MTEYAHGLRGVTVAETRLSMVDGEAGRLLIAGFPLEELAPNASFEEVLYLLWHDRLPTRSELETLCNEMVANRAVPPMTLDILRAAASRRLVPMDALRLGVDSLSLSSEVPTDTSREAKVQLATCIVACMPTILAAYWRLLHDAEPIAPNPELGHAANYLYMLTGEQPNPEATRALETYLNTVVDHGMNNSTFTARVITSTETDMISAIVGAIGSLKGPLHGGAPGPAIDMVFDIQHAAAKSGRSVADEAEEWVTETLGAGRRIMGFGHRIYRVRDPRADVLADEAVRLFERAGDTRLYQDARTVEDVILRRLEQHRPGRSLKTNVEFYTALVLHGVGLEADLFSPTFAIARVGGWTAHVLEQSLSHEIFRPNVAYVGANDRHWVPVEERKGA